jgi:periplasmic divalent cation tolerance protein
VAVVILITSIGAESDAAGFARTLVEERLAACVNVLPPMGSVYRWKGAVEEAREQLLLIKTSEDRVTDLMKRFGTLHPYELPEFVVVRPDDVAWLYAGWVEEAVSEEGSD